MKHLPQIRKQIKYITLNILTWLTYGVFLQAFLFLPCKITNNLQIIVVG